MLAHFCVERCYEKIINAELYCFFCYRHMQFKFALAAPSGGHSYIYVNTIYLLIPLYRKPCRVLICRYLLESAPESEIGDF